VSTTLPQLEVPHSGEAPPVRQERLPPRLSRSRRVSFILAGLWILSSFYIVLPDQQAVETVFGRVTTPRVLPGLHFALPWPFGRVARIKVRQLQRLMIGGSLGDAVTGRSQPLVSQFLTGDQNLIHVRAVVQYSVSSPVDYLFRSQDPAQLVGAVLEAEIARRIAHRPVDAVLTTEKTAIQSETLAAAQQRLNDYGCGVALSTVNLESIAPPAEAADAFRDVASARADAARIANDAQGYANGLLPRARGEARQLLEEAAAYRERKINEANGDAARFNQIAAEYTRASQVTARRLYLETMEQVLPRIRKLIVDQRGNLDVTIVRKGDTTGAK
jgi:membrane protease subunit HflK